MQTGAYAIEWVQKRYNDEIQTAKDELLGKDGRDPEAYINRVMEINATYAGLTKSGSYQVSMSNGQDGLTSNEIIQNSTLLLAADGTVYRSEMQLQKIANMEKEVQGSTMSLSTFLQEHQNTMERRKNNGYHQGSMAAKLLAATVNALIEAMEFEEKQSNTQVGEKFTNGKKLDDGIAGYNAKGKEAEVTDATVPTYIFNLVGPAGVAGTLVNSNIFGGNFSQIEIMGFDLLQPDGGSGITYGIKITNNNTGEIIFSEKYTTSGVNGGSIADLRKEFISAEGLFNNVFKGNFNYRIEVSTTRSYKSTNNNGTINYYDGCYNLGIKYRVTR